MLFTLTRPTLKFESWHLVQLKHKT